MRKAFGHFRHGTAERYHAALPVWREHEAAEIGPGEMFQRCARCRQWVAELRFAWSPGPIWQRLGGPTRWVAARPEDGCEIAPCEPERPPAA